MTQRREPPRLRLGSAQRLKGRDGVLGLEKGLTTVACEPRVGLESARGVSSHTEHDACVVAGAAEQKREHRRATKAAVFPYSPAAMQDAVDVKSEMSRDHALAAGRNALEPREGAIGGEELECARDGRARRHDLDLRAQPHASEQERRSQRAAAMHHLLMYEGTFASADTSNRIHMPLGACPGTPHAMRYCPAVDALKVV
jgi:hypothetical protein